MEGAKEITIAVIDDHNLIRNKVCEFLESLGGVRVLFQAENGQVCMERIIEDKLVPDVCVLDVNMPVLNGFDTAKALRYKYPDMKILAFSMNNDEKNIVGMLRNGANGYIIKGGNPEELKNAIEIVYKEGYYFNTEVGKAILRYIQKEGKN